MNNTATASTRGQQALAGAHILTLDDDANMRSIIRTVLSQCGCRDILQAGDGRVALKLFAGHPIDLVICDWMMEPMNGFDFLTELRKFAKGAQVPVIMLTGNSEPTDALAAQHLNIAAWLVKPIAPKQMIERISSVLSLPTQLFSIEDDLNVDLSGLAGQYRAKLSNEIRELNDLVASFQQQPRNSVLHHWSSMVRLFHTVKGQAGTFGYDLITTLGGNGQNLLREAEGNVDVLIKFQAQLQRALTVLVGAMSLVLQNDIKGDAGNVGGRLLAKISEATVPLRQMIEAELKNAKK
jgi:two-component system chemotaxis response regulator CheY